MLINHAYRLVTEIGELSAASATALQRGDPGVAELFAGALATRAEELGRVRLELDRLSRSQ